MKFNEENLNNNFVQAMDIEKKIDIDATKKMETRDSSEFVYSINQDLQFDLSYGVTKI